MGGANRPSPTPPAALEGPDRLLVPLATRPTSWDEARVGTPALNVSMDAMLVPTATDGLRVATAHVVALDGVVDDDMRARFLECITREGSDEASGAEPPSETWERRTTDRPPAGDARDDDDQTAAAADDDDDSRRHWGLRPAAMSHLERTLAVEDWAFLEFHARLAVLFPDHVVCHMPARAMRSHRQDRDGDESFRCDAFVANALGFLDDGRDDALALLDRFKRDLEGFHGKNSNDVSDSDVSDDDDDEEEEDQEARRDASRVKRRPVKRRPAAVTVPEPFNIARSRPRPAPPVEAKPEPFKAKPVPISTRRFGPTAEQIAVRRAEARNREAVAAKYADPRLAFRLRAVERPSNVEKVRAEMEAREIAAIEAERASVIPIARSVPASNAPGFVDPKAGPVKTNAAAILRADAVLRARREKEMAAVEDFEAGLRDSSEYEAGARRCGWRRGEPSRGGGQNAGGFGCAHEEARARARRGGGGAGGARRGDAERTRDAATARDASERANSRTPKRLVIKSHQRNAWAWNKRVLFWRRKETRR